MLTTLNVPYVDTNAHELVWTLDHPQAPALTTRALSVRGADVELRVLGASHQVVVRRNGAELIETVACLPGVEPHLPATAVCSVQGRTYTFESRVTDVPPRELRRRVAELGRMTERSKNKVLLAAFPGEPDAVTALRLDGDTSGVRWRTWHVYPRSTQIVQTSTEVL